MMNTTNPPILVIKEVIVALIGIKRSYSCPPDFQGISLDWPIPFFWFLFCKNPIIRKSYLIPIIRTVNTLMKWNIVRNGFPFVIDPMHIVADVGVPNTIVLKNDIGPRVNSSNTP